MKRTSILCRFVFITLSINLTFSSYAQEKFLPGYVISLEGDTLTGTVSYKDWYQNPEWVEIQLEDGGERNSYSAYDIKEFYVSGELYISAEVDIEVSQFQKYPVLEFSRSPMIERKRVFLRTILLGTKSLYQFIGKAEKYNFYIKLNNNYELLYYKQYYVYEKNDHYYRENKKFIGQLIIYLGDCTELGSKIQNLKYNGNDLEKLFLDYYKCINESFIFYSEPDKWETRFGLIGGITSTTFNLFSDSENFLKSVNLPFSTQPTYGIFFNSIMPGNLDLKSIRTDLMLSSYYVDAEQYVGTTTYNVSLQARAFMINSMYQQKFPIGKAFLYATAGGSIALHYARYSHIVEENNGTHKLIDVASGVLDIGLSAGGGLQIGHFLFEARYAVGTGLLYGEDPVDMSSRLYFLAGIQF